MRSQVQNIARSAAYNLVGQFAADGFGESVDHLEDGAALAGAQVPSADARVVGAEVVERDQVAAR